MPYIEKDQNGFIVGVFANRQPGFAEELVSENSEELAAFYKSKEPTYADKRAAEYPALGDQLDDLFKQGAFSAEMAAKLQAVKDKYPKG